MSDKISDIRDVSNFFHRLVEEVVNAHPDEDFSNYINERTYTAGDAALRNRLMLQCFAVCVKSGVDIYDLMQEIYLAETGLNKHIPGPSR